MAVVLQIVQYLAEDKSQIFPWGTNVKKWIQVIDILNIMVLDLNESLNRSYSANTDETENCANPVAISSKYAPIIIWIFITYSFLIDTIGFKLVLSVSRDQNFHQWPWNIHVAP